MFVLGSALLARVIENGCWNDDVHCVLVRMLCLFSISGQKFHFDLLMMMSSAINPRNFKPRTSFDRVLAAGVLFLHERHCCTAMHESPLATSLSETVRFT